MPRITRAQSMDALSSMATIAGYKGVLMAANHLPRMFPMLMTAAGTLTAARVFIVGVGVAGLQAIATARRLGARVEAYDVRPAVKEQVQSLGARFVEMPLETADAEDKGGYAKAQDESFYRRQREMMLKVVAGERRGHHDGADSRQEGADPRHDARWSKAMAPGSVVVDLAAERGGNCELTRPDEVVVHNGVTILGPSNPPALVPNHASQMYSKNITTFLSHLLGKDGAEEGVARARSRRRDHAGDAADARRRRRPPAGEGSPGRRGAVPDDVDPQDADDAEAPFTVPHPAGQHQDRRPRAARRLHRRRRARVAAPLPADRRRHRARGRRPGEHERHVRQRRARPSGRC